MWLVRILKTRIIGKNVDLVIFIWKMGFLSALTKSVGLRMDGRIDDRSFWINYVSSLSTPLAIPLVYPRMISVHDLDAKVYDGATFS